MINDSERREIAARLRFTDHNMTWSEGCFCIADDVGAAPTGNEHDDVLAFAHALADLIEPEPERTCKMIPFVEEDDSIFIVNCSECGEALFARGGYHNCNYCPNCGAKVVE